jgi:protein SCO1
VREVKLKIVLTSLLSSGLRDLFCALVLFVFALGFSGCSGSASSPAIKHYSLHGKVMSIDKMGHELIVDHDAIPGFMEGMTMPYAVTDNKLLSQVGPGDEIKADLQVQGDHIAIDQLQVLTKAPPGTTPAQPQATHVPEIGEKVPNFVLTNQNGKRVRLDDYRGKTLLITFFYTRCTLNDYCPRMNGNFATVDKSLAKNPELYAKTHLISISFDPQHDTPEVLRSYGSAYTERYVKENFNHWEFATAPPDELKPLADFFGVYYEKDGNSITHSLSTAVIGPDGEIKAWYPGNRWQPEEALQAVNEAMASSEQARVASSQPASKDSKPH